MVELSGARGHEQRGVRSCVRPCVLVSDPEVLADQRYSMVGVVPLSGTPGEGALYPRIEPGPSGLRKASFALVDQVRSLDKRRISRVFGGVSAEELEAIDEGLRLFLGLSV